MKNVGRRSDGVAAEKKSQAGLVCGGDEAHGKSLIPTDIPVNAGRKLRWRNFVTDLEGFGGFAVRVTSLQSQLVGFHQQRLLAELLFNPAVRGVCGSVVEPVAHSQGEEVLAAIHSFCVQAKMLKSRAR